MINDHQSPQPKSQKARLAIVCPIETWQHAPTSLQQRGDEGPSTENMARATREGRDCRWELLTRCEHREGGKEKLHFQNKTEPRGGHVYHDDRAPWGCNRHGQWLTNTDREPGSYTYSQCRCQDLLLLTSLSESLSV
jgi:hypothetical protein